MTEESNNEQDEGLSKYYQLKTQDEKEAFKNQREDYFSKVSGLIPQVAAAKSKLEEIQAALRIKVKELEEQIKKNAKDASHQASSQGSSATKFSEKTSSQQNDGEEDDLLRQDLAFCKLGLVEGVQIGSKMDNDKATLENIVATREKKPYRVITDIALNPLPSDRAKDKNKNKDKDKDKNKDNQKNQAKKNGNKKSLSAEDFKKLRNGIPLEEQENLPTDSAQKSRRSNIKLLPSQIYQHPAGRI